MVLTRFAPTPSGYLHLGNAFSFVLTWLLARLQGGKILLRIDDLDNDRFRPEYLDDIFYSLEWLGLDYDLGPAGAADFYATWSQHKRLDLYYEALASLRSHLFACICSRKIWQQASPDGQYPGTCLLRELPLTAPHAAWRLVTPAQKTVGFTEVGKTEPTQASPCQWMRHPVLRRKDGLPAYQLASVIDDGHFGISLVVRGQDLFASTVIQTYLAECLGAKQFATIAFHHHPLLKNANGEKLSKSAGSLSLKAIAQQEKTPARIYALVSAALFSGKCTAQSAAELLSQVTIQDILDAHVVPDVRC
ncbi:MAG: glutamate--tRNA ligase family protein [Cytophagales bacterium]|nr:glutamate--tRNA ligase family protein [Cytophagales bacterium]